MYVSKRHPFVNSGGGEMMNTLFVISGVTGMTGNELSRQIIRRGDHVIGFDNFFASSLHTVEDILEEDAFEFYEMDLNSHSDMQKIKNKVMSEKESYKTVVYINCAAVVHTEHFYHVYHTYQTNVEGMRDFLAQAIEVGAYAFVNCSTSEVYSMQSWSEGGVREEDYIVMATAENSQRTSYATGKLLTEFFMKDAVDEGKIKGCSLRFANVYSKNELYPKHIIPHIMNSLIEKKSVVLLENSRKNRRTFLHNTDSCEAVLAVLDHEAALDGTVYNVATQEEVTILELVELCAHELHIDTYEVIFDGYRESDPERRVLSTQKIWERTGWTPKIMLKEGLKMCAQSYGRTEI